MLQEFGDDNHALGTSHRCFCLLSNAARSAAVALNSRVSLSTPSTDDTLSASGSCAAGRYASRDDSHELNASGQLLNPSETRTSSPCCSAPCTSPHTRRGCSALVTDSSGNGKATRGRIDSSCSASSVHPANLSPGPPSPRETNSAPCGVWCAPTDWRLGDNFNL